MKIYSRSEMVVLLFRALPDPQHVKAIVGLDNADEPGPFNLQWKGMWFTIDSREFSVERGDDGVDFASQIACSLLLGLLVKAAEQNEAEG